MTRFVPFDQRHGTIPDVNADREREWARTIASLDAQYREVAAARPDLVEAWEASWNRKPDPMAKHPPELVADTAETDRLMDEAFSRFKLHRSPSRYRQECRAIIERPEVQWARLNRAMDEHRIKGGDRG